MAVKESDLEQSFIKKLEELKYTYRPDIRDKATLEQNFREKFEKLNHVNLTDAEFARLRDEIINADVFQAAKILREYGHFQREDGTPYAWVKYIYIDDPISSLDDNNAISVVSHLAQLLKAGSGHIKTVISTHHHLFFNVMFNELSRGIKYFFSREEGRFLLTDTGETPRYHHVALLKQLHEAAVSGEIYTYHFNILRSLLEKTATFHGFRNFSACIKRGSDDPDGILHARLVNVLSHGNYSLYEPREMLPENKEYFRRILQDFMSNYRFNPELFPATDEVKT